MDKCYLRRMALNHVLFYFTDYGEWKNLMVKRAVRDVMFQDIEQGSGKIAD